MTRPFWVLILRLGVTLLALVLIARALGTEAIVVALRNTQPLWVGLAVGALASQIALSALRWQETARALGLAFPRGLALREYWLAVLGNTVLPGGVLGDVGRAVRMQGQAGLAAAAETVVIERLAGQLALGFVTCAGLALWLAPHPAAFAASAGGIGLAGMIWLVLWQAGRMPGRAGRVGARLRLAWWAERIWQRQLGLSAAILLSNLLGFWAAAHAVGITLDLRAAVFLLPLTLMAMLVPLSINGWGLREGAAAALWPIAGVAASDAVAASLLFGIAALIAAVPGTFGLLYKSRAKVTAD